MDSLLTAQVLFRAKKNEVQLKKASSGEAQLKRASSGEAGEVKMNGETLDVHFSDERKSEEH